MGKGGMEFGSVVTRIPGLVLELCWIGLHLVQFTILKKTIFSQCDPITWQWNENSCERLKGRFLSPVLYRKLFTTWGGSRLEVRGISSSLNLWFIVSTGVARWDIWHCYSYSWGESLNIRRNRHLNNASLAKDLSLTSLHELSPCCIPSYWGSSDYP